MKKIKIFDTTLRDGEQSPGVNLTIQEKVTIAKQLELLNVDIIEAGFPFASKGESSAVRDIAKSIKNATVCGLSRAMPEDIKFTWDSLKFAEKPRIHTFLATSKIHMKYKLQKTEKEIIHMIRNAVETAKGYCDDIEFSPEDASRSESNFLFEAIETAIDAGATTINIPDTVGYIQTTEFGSLISDVRKNVGNTNNITISVHCHNDLGLAVANSLEAIKNGATQVECTINGIGERAGNTSLEEFVMNLSVRKDYFSSYTNINTEQIYPTSQLVSELTGMTVQRNKAIVGENAFAHEAGIHQHGILSNKATYEIMTPESVGWIGDTFVIGKLSGSHAIKSILDNREIKTTASQLQTITKIVKQYIDQNKGISKSKIFEIATNVINRTIIGQSGNNKSTVITKIVSEEAFGHNSGKIVDQPIVQSIRQFSNLDEPID